jgi:NodT family efflux transporter outer membrane factor (OMF) lipoprotein
MRAVRTAWALAAVCTLAACKVGPNFTEPKEPVPDHYAGTVGAEAADAAPQSFWWQEFHDPELDRLESQVAAGNLDLKASFLRIVVARNQAQQARSQGLPSLNGTASFNRDQLGLAGILKSQNVNVTSPNEQNLLGTLEKPVNIFQLGFDASWELDLFGKVRRAVEAADANSLATVEARNDLLVSLRAEVAQTYFQLRAAQMLRKATADQIAAQRDVLELTQSRHQHGLAGEADVDTARAQLASLQSDLPPYDQTIATSRHAIAVLTGQIPEALDAEFGESGELPALPQAVPVGLPATLARRRPDIRESEATLHAATAEVGVSVASLFPDISLTGTYGLRNLSPGYLFDWDSRFYTFGSSVSVPIFHGGALVANVRLSRAQAAEAALQYRRTVLGALQEVEDGLSNLRQDALRTAALKESLASNQRALAVDVDAYQHGLITYISVLTVQIQTVQAQQQLAQAVLAQSTDLVKLYKALGGGWQDAPPSEAPNTESGHP